MAHKTKTARQNPRPPASARGTAIGIRGRRFWPPRRRGILRSSAVTAKDPVSTSCAARDLHDFEPGCAQLTLRDWVPASPRLVGGARTTPSTRSSVQAVTAAHAVRYSKLRRLLRVRPQTKRQASPRGACTKPCSAFTEPQRYRLGKPPTRYHDHAAEPRTARSGVFSGDRQRSLIHRCRRHAGLPSVTQNVRSIRVKHLLCGLPRRGAIVKRSL